MMQTCQSNVWNRNYVLLLMANCLLYVSMYALIPVLPLPGYLTALFCFSLPLLGIFNNYLVDTFKRKNVYILPVFLLSVCTLLYIYTIRMEVMIGLRIIQGALFGLALMTTGCTLVIDVTPGCNRNAANFYFAWSGAIGLLGGLGLGAFMMQNMTFQDTLLTSSGLSILSLFLVAWVRVSFRAPLELPFISCDRFLLRRTFLPGINLMVLPAVLGMLLCFVGNPYYYLCLAAGFITFLFIRPFIPKSTDGRMLVTLGIVVAAIGLVLLLRNRTYNYLPYLSGFMVGLGLSLALLHFLRMMILLPAHCERGTGFHTYTLMWEFGVGIGMVLIFDHVRMDLPTMVSYALVVLAVGGLFYLFITHPYYKKALKNRTQTY